MKRFEDFTTEDLKKLRSEICLNRLYVSDYNNSFGLDPHYVSDFFDGYISYMNELMEEDGKNLDWEDQVEEYDNIDNLEGWYGCFDEFGAKYDFEEADNFEEYNEILLTSKEHFGDKEEHEYTMRFYDSIAYYDGTTDDDEATFTLLYPSMEELMRDPKKWQAVVDYTGRTNVTPYDIALKFGQICDWEEPEERETYKVVYVVADETDHVETVFGLTNAYDKGVEFIKANIDNYPDARVEVMSVFEDERHPYEDFRVLKRDIYDHDNFFWTMMRVSNGVRISEYFPD